MQWQGLGNRDPVPYVPHSLSKCISSRMQPWNKGMLVTPLGSEDGVSLLACVTSAHHSIGSSGFGLCPHMGSASFPESQCWEQAQVAF